MLARFFSQVLALLAEFAVFVPGVFRERKHFRGTARLKTLEVLRIDFFRASPELVECARLPSLVLVVCDPALNVAKLWALFVLSDEPENNRRAGVGADT